MKIHPVISFLDGPTTYHQAAIAQQSGADGILVSASSHQVKDALRVSCATKQLFPQLRVIFRAQGMGALDCLTGAVTSLLDGIWIDGDVISSSSFSGELGAASDFAKDNPDFTIYLGISASPAARPMGHIEREASKFSLRKAFFFDNKPDDSLTLDAACKALEAGFLPLVDWANATDASSWETPSARSDRFVKLFDAVKGNVAIATGTSALSMFSYAPYVSHIIETKSTNIAEYSHDLERVRPLLNSSGQAALPVMI